MPEDLSSLLQIRDEAQFGVHCYGAGQSGIRGDVVCQQSKRGGQPPKQESSPGDRTLLGSSIPQPFVPRVEPDERIAASNPGAIGQEELLLALLG
jgi:hypothetical protein